MNLSFSLILALLVLLSTGFGAGLWFGRLLARARADGELAQAQAEAAARLAAAETRAAQAQGFERELAQLRDDHAQLRSLLAAAETELKGERENAAEKIELLSKAREALSKAKGVSLIDDRANNRFPMPLDATTKDDVYVGRIRRDISRDDDKGLELFVCGDQIKKGAALNAVQIAELLL